MDSLSILCWHQSDLRFTLQRSFQAHWEWIMAHWASSQCVVTISRSQEGFPEEDVVISHWMLFSFSFLLLFALKSWTRKVPRLKAGKTWKASADIHEIRVTLARANQQGKQFATALINETDINAIRSVHLNTFHFNTQLVVTDLSISHN